MTAVNIKDLGLGISLLQIGKKQRSLLLVGLFAHNEDQNVSSFRVIFAAENAHGVRAFLLLGEDVLANVKRYTRNGSIITFHDSLRSEENLRYALPRAIEWLLEQGYEFKIFE